MQRLLPLTWLFVIIVSFVITAFAQDEAVTVRVDGRSVFRVSANEDNDAATRARQIERRLDTLLETPQAISPARIETSADERIITVSGIPVVTVSQTDADDNVTTLDDLARLWAGAINSELERGRERRLSAWGRFTAEVQASVQTAFSRLLESAITIIPRGLAAILVIGLFWFIAAFVRRFMRFIFRRVVEDLTVENLIKQVAYYTIWILGLIVAADALGFDPQTVITGLGITGLALGFALKDILSNFVSGLLILVLRPFKLGDQIVVGETEGNVERIELRATQIRTYDGRVVLVPNAEVFTSRITNNTAQPVRRGSVELFLGYNSDLQTATRVIREATQGTEGVMAEPPASVRVQELGQDDIIVEARFWTDSRRSDFVLTTSEVRERIVAALKVANIGLPEPDVRLLVPRQAQAWKKVLGERG
jgi:small conductance mechanosensitive channel